jgi:hypothetical protein
MIDVHNLALPYFGLNGYVDGKNSVAAGPFIRVNLCGLCQGFLFWTSRLCCRAL